MNFGCESLQIHFLAQILQSYTPPCITMWLFFFFIYFEVLNSFWNLFKDQRFVWLIVMYLVSEMVTKNESSIYMLCHVINSSCCFFCDPLYSAWCCHWSRKASCKRLDSWKEKGQGLISIEEEKDARRIIEASWYLAY